MLSISDTCLGSWQSRLKPRIKIFFVLLDKSVLLLWYSNIQFRKTNNTELFICISNPSPSITAHIQVLNLCFIDFKSDMQLWKSSLFSTFVNKLLNDVFYSHFKLAINSSKVFVFNVCSVYNIIYMFSFINSYILTCTACLKKRRCKKFVFIFTIILCNLFCCLLLYISFHEHISDCIILSELLLMLIHKSNLVNSFTSWNSIGFVHSHVFICYIFKLKQQQFVFLRHWWDELVFVMLNKMLQHVELCLLYV